VPKTKTRPELCIVESLSFLDGDALKEGDVIARTLRMSGKSPHYVSLRTRGEFGAFAEEFGQSSYRYLHISCHGNKGCFWTTLDCIPNEEMVQILRPHLKGRRLFVSACLSTDDEFARSVISNGCLSVAGPSGSPNFDDATIFWTSFYHVMFKKDAAGMSSSNIAKAMGVCATLVEEEFRFFFKSGKRVVEKELS
jgi:hypothetical protein